jgi:hypothetical protein
MGNKAIGLLSNRDRNAIIKYLKDIAKICNDKDFPYGAKQFILASVQPLIVLYGFTLYTDTLTIIQNIISPKKEN